MKKCSLILVVVLIVCMFSLPVFAEEQSVISENFDSTDIASYSGNFGFEDATKWGVENTEAAFVDKCPVLIGVDDDGVFCAKWSSGRVMAVLPEVMPRESYIFTADLCAGGINSGFAIRQTNTYSKIIEDTAGGGMGTEGICFLLNASVNPATLKITIQQKSTDPANTYGIKTIATPITLPAGAEINPEPALTPVKLVDNGTMIIAYIKDIKVATIELSDLANDNYATAVIKDSTGTVLTTVSDAVIPSQSKDDSYMAFLNRTDYFLVDNFNLYSSDGTNDGSTLNVVTPTTPSEPTPTAPVTVPNNLTITVVSGAENNPAISIFGPVGTKSEVKDADVGVGPNINLTFNDGDPNTFGKEGAEVKFTSPFAGTADVILTMYFPDAGNGADTTAYKLSYQTNNGTYQVASLNPTNTAVGVALAKLDFKITVPVVKGENTLYLMNANEKPDGTHPVWRSCVTELQFTFNDGGKVNPPTSDFSMIPMLSVALLSTVTMLRKKRSN
jgi:hypothetical protein